jgi:predicted small metal-binding protein
LREGQSSSGCHHLIHGQTEEEVLEQARAHAQEHGLEPTPELLEKVKAAIEDE